jgi:DNA-binding transcriptional LysR family regulator
VNLGQLEGFVVVAEELHFGSAATRLGASTSNLSRRIADLEHEFGVRLFERTSRHVQLTPAGVLLLDSARRALAELQHLQNTAANAAEGRAGVVHIAYAPGNGPTMAALVREIRSSSLKVDVTLEQATSIQVAEAVRSGRAAIGLCRDVARSELNRIVMTRSPRDLLAMPPDHPLARREAVTVADLYGETILHFDSSIAGLASDPLVSLPGVHLDVKFERVVTETEAMDRVAAGFGLALVSHAFWGRNTRPDVQVCPVTGLPIEPMDTSYLIWRVDDDSRLVGMILNHARRLTTA